MEPATCDRVLKIADHKFVGERKEEWYTLTLTNMEVAIMFENMVKGWFSEADTKVYYNEFIKALFNDNVRKMNKLAIWEKRKSESGTGRGL